MRLPLASVWLAFWCVAAAATAATAAHRPACNPAAPEIETHPAPVVGLHDAVAVATGTRHTCAIVADGSVRCWGANEAGQLGDGTVNDSDLPVIVKDVAKATSLALAEAYTCVTVTDGSVRCWGAHMGFRLGTEPVSLTPVALPMISGARALGVASHGTCVLTAAGQVECWGRSLLGPPVLPLRISKTVMALAPSSVYSDGCALLADRSVACWADNGTARAGDGGAIVLSAPVSVRGVRDATRVAIHTHYGCAVVTGGRVRCWGGPYLPPAAQIPAPPVKVPMVRGATALSAGETKTCAVVARGTVLCWTPSPHPTPGPVAGLTGVTSLSVGYHNCAVANGTVHCWGSNENGQLGRGVTPCLPIVYPAARPR